MKVINKEVKECELTTWEKNTVLDLIYSHRWKEGRILIKDYEDKFYDKILKQLRIEVRNSYNKQLIKEEA